jgi:hypothetical protein
VESCEKAVAVLRRLIRKGLAAVESSGGSCGHGQLRHDVLPCGLLKEMKGGSEAECTELYPKSVDIFPIWDARLEVCISHTYFIRLF